MNIEIRTATVADAEKILAIYSPYVENTAVSFEYVPPSIEEFRERIRKTLEKFPYLVAVCNNEIIGYEFINLGRMMDMIKAMDTDRIMYIHNDMYKEIKSKNNLNQKVYRDCLEKYDKIVCIRDTSKQEIIAYNNNIRPDHVFVAHNLNNIQTIREKALLPLEFDKDTFCNAKFKIQNSKLYNYVMPHFHTRDG